VRRQGRWRANALSILAGGILFLASPAGAAEWISGYDDSTTGWLKDIEQKLNSEEYRAIFTNDPRTPQESVMRFLNNAARAYEGKNPAMAESLIKRAVGVLEAGVSKHYYSEADVAPIVSYNCPLATNNHPSARSPTSIVGAPRPVAAACHCSGCRANRWIPCASWLCVVSMPPFSAPTAAGDSAY
jgi:hypothetical protein